MFARLTLAHPQAERIDGYRGFLLLVDRDAAQLTGISFWASEADRQASAGASGYYQDGVARFTQLLTAPPMTTDVDVAIHDFRSV
jgi:heme-degrading monooxygenase HmoA